MSPRPSTARTEVPDEDGDLPGQVENNEDEEEDAGEEGEEGDNKDGEEEDNVEGTEENPEEAEDVEMDEPGTIFFEIVNVSCVGSECP